MKKNSNYNKTYDIFDEGFHDRYRYNLYNPFGYTIEKSIRNSKDFDKDCFKSKDNYLGSHNFINKNK